MRRVSLLVKQFSQQCRQTCGTVELISCRWVLLFVLGAQNSDAAGQASVSAHDDVAWSIADDQAAIEVNAALLSSLQEHFR